MTVRTRSRLEARAVALVAAVAMVGGLGAAGRDLVGSGPDRAGSTSSTACPWLTSTAPAATKAAQVEAAMTEAEKIGMVDVAATDGYENATTAVPRLCVPALTLQDGPAGVTAGPAGSATQLPAPIALAATWSTAQAAAYGQTEGREALAKGVDAVQGPDVNIARVPQGGRVFEGFGEDPYLAGQLAVADIGGIQGTGVMAVLKHFAVYNQETNRNTPADDAVVSDRALHEIYLPAFQAAVQQGRVAAVMCAYSTINGTPACQDGPLLTDILEDQWGFAGFVRSDFGAVHNVTAAFDAGLDMMKPSQSPDIAAGVLTGAVPGSRLDDAVVRILTEMFRFGLFTRTPAGTAATNATGPGDTAVALATAEDGTVLLQDTGGALPLDPATVASVAVIGADGGSGADVAPNPGSSALVGATSLVTPYQGLSAALPRAHVTYNDGTDLTAAAAAAAAARVAVVFVDSPEGEGADLSTLELPGDQDALVAAVAAANPDTVVVVNSGGPVLMPWLSSVRAVVEAWYPGQVDGTAIAAVLTGAVDPSGKLPVTFPTSDTATPTGTPAQWPGVGTTVQYSEGLRVGYRGYQAEGITPLFPFGFGLSYTTFAYSGIHVTPGRTSDVVTDPDAAAGTSPVLATVTATVTNTGAVAGSDVAQLYIGDPASAGEPPLQLEGFEDVTLAPGASTTVSFPVDARALSTWDAAAGGWVVPDGRFGVEVGDASAAADLPLHASLTVAHSVGARWAGMDTPAVLPPGTSTRVTAVFHNLGDYRLRAVRPSLALPRGWSATDIDRHPLGVVAAHRSVTRTWRVTVPENAQGGQASLTASLSYLSGTGADAQPRRVLRATTTATVRPLVSATTATVVAAAGGSTRATVDLTNHLPQGVRLTYTTGNTLGAAASPAGGSFVIGRHGWKIHVRLAVPAGTAPGTYRLTVRITATLDKHRYQLLPVIVPVLVAYPDLAAADNNVGVTTDADPGAGDFDSSGNTYSATALAAMGITPGGTVEAGGLGFTWPTAAPGTPDNVALDGQAVTVGASGSLLGFVGAAVTTTQRATGTIYYTDGTTQTFTLTEANWFALNPAAGTTLVATLPYLNRTNGKAPNPVSLFEDSVAINPAKTVAAVVLPSIPPDTLMHVFALTVATPVPPPPTPTTTTTTTAPTPTTTTVPSTTTTLHPTTTTTVHATTTTTGHPTTT